VSWGELAEGFAAALVIAAVTTPVGVSGAVFLLPVQLNVLHVPNPAVTPTNLMFNIVAGPGALLRYRRSGQLTSTLTRLLLVGTLPGVIVGAVVRVYLLPGPKAFRLVVAAVLLPLGLWLVARARTRRMPRPRSPLGPRTISGLSLAVGVVGGIYGIGGGSILGPILVGSGLLVSEVAPAALASTFVTSLVGALTYVVLAINATGSIAPRWRVGLACGLGGLVGGYLGARLQPRMPDRALRLLLGVLAIALSALYLVEAFG
jgi:uncharacterized membrane protein YfcA